MSDFGRFSALAESSALEVRKFISEDLKDNSEQEVQEKIPFCKRIVVNRKTHSFHYKFR